MLHRSLYTFLRQHPSTLRSVALRQCSRPENPSGKENPAGCLPKGGKEERLELLLDDRSVVVVFFISARPVSKIQAEQPQHVHISDWSLCEPYWRNSSLDLIFHPSLNVFQLVLQLHQILELAQRTLHTNRDKQQVVKL